MKILQSKTKAIWLRSVIAGALVAATVAASAQTTTPAEQSELDAAASADTTFGTHAVRGTFSCGAGTVPTQFYFNDFESDDGGWSSAGIPDWEQGAVVTGVFENCDSPEPEPSGAFSGSNAWATNLDGCYTNSGDTATMTQTFDFSSLNAPIELSLQQWLHVFGSFDTADLTVNGDQLFFEDSSTASTAYEPLELDLSAYAGLSSVTVDLNVNATTVVNRSGWYVDDVSITSCQPDGGMPPGFEPIPTMKTTGILAMIFLLLIAGGIVMRKRG